MDWNKFKGKSPNMQILPLSIFIHMSSYIVSYVHKCSQDQVLRLYKKLLVCSAYYCE